jgi:hypothetical protein
MSKKFSITLDRSSWLRATGLLDRKTIFLDLNFWITMSEGEKASYRQLEKLLFDMVAAGEAVCPVCPTLLLEVKKRPISDKRTQYCDLMDELSCGLSLRHWTITFREEFRSTVEGHPVERELGYSHFIEALSIATHIEFDQTWPRADANQAASLISDHLHQVPIREMVNIEMEPHREGSITSLRTGLVELSRQEKEWRNEHSATSEDVERAEFSATLRALIPQILNSLQELDTSLLHKLISIPLEEKAALLDQCPTFYCQYKLVSALRSSRPRVKENELWDLEHAATALPYVDCFACDRGARHLCSDMLHLDDRFGTEVLSSVDDLIDWIQSA